jgi:lysophospholipase L1-like esterase
MPYQVITNIQGLRMEYDLTFPKQKQRILILGDSFTFGPYLSNHHCYPNLLDKKYSDKEIINAGKAGYTVTDEVSLFMERAKYVEPDITVLQVLENDIEELFYFLKNQYNRKGRTFKPSQEEIELMQQLTGI